MKTKKWITYTIYGALITAAFLYFLFPSDSAGKYIRSIVEGINPNVVLSFDSARPCFPPGIRLHNFSVSFKNKPGSTIRADALKLRSALTSLLSGKLSLLLYADAYEGSMQADINFASRFSTVSPVRMNARLDNINIGKCTYIKTVSNRRIDGKLGGTLSYNGSRGTGSARFMILDGNIQLLKSMFGFDGLAFDKVDVELTLKKHILKIIRLDIKGKQLSGSFTGNIFLDRDIMQSRLAIKGSIEIPALDRKISTTLNGTVSRPIPGFI